jgi:uncharacterized integral membrane protein
MTVEQPAGSPGAHPPWRPSAREVATFIVVVLVLVFALVNWEDADIDFVFGHVTVPVFFVIAIPSLVAFGAGMFFQHRRSRR